VRHPIYPDVISFAAADYSITRTGAKLADGRQLPIELYVFPEDSAKAVADFSSVPAILQFIESRLGPYPFRDEKYALAEMTRPSFREGQTITNIGANFLNGKHEADQVIAHEVSHQWFGNSLTVKSWSDIWLNESLSEFMAWQWIRHSQGDSAYKSLFDEARKSSLAVAMAPASATDFGTLFGPGTFVKGPVVISMLRDLVGEEKFDRALRAYVARNQYGTVTAADFKRAFETEYGKPLGEFFQKWVYGKLDPFHSQ
jgi:aminopeptidase N